MDSFAICPQCNASFSAHPCLFHSVCSFFWILERTFHQHQSRSRRTAGRGWSLHDRRAAHDKAQRLAVEIQLALKKHCLFGQFFDQHLGSKHCYSRCIGWQFENKIFNFLSSRNFRFCEIYRCDKPYSWPYKPHTHVSGIVCCPYFQESKIFFLQSCSALLTSQPTQVFKINWF